MRKKNFFVLSVLFFLIGCGEIDWNNEDVKELLPGIVPSLPSPDNIKIEDGVLTWDSVEGAAGYIVYYGDERKVLDASVTSFTLPSLKGGGSMNVALKAIGNGKDLKDSSVSFYLTYSTDMPFIEESGNTEAPDPLLPIPTESQLKWQSMGQYAFIHWGPNAFGEGDIGNGEWGNGYPAGAAAFQPGSDADTITQGWIDNVVTAGMTGIIMVAKHHDGFCLWDTVTTQYSVCKSGTGYSYHDEDYLKALIENMRDYNRAHPEAPLKLGVYVSPWDRNNWTYAGVDDEGKFPYLEYVFRTQVTEVVHYVEEYGEGDVILFELWLDGANEPSGWYGGQLYDAHVREGSSVTVPILDNGRADFTKFEQNYNYSGKLNSNLTHRSVTLPSDWRARIYSVAQEVVDSYKPTEDHEVMIFGSQIRWVGNEQGWAGRTCWAMGSEEYGSEDGQTWFPAEADMKTQNGWFYTPGEDKGAAKMIEFWYRSVGRNATLLLNFSPDTDGVIPSNNLTSAQTMWRQVSEDFRTDLLTEENVASVEASNIRGGQETFDPYNLIDDDFDTYWTVNNEVTSGSVTFTFKNPITFDRIVLQEYVTLGQRVKSFTVEAQDESGAWKSVELPNMPTTIGGDSSNPDETTTIGYKRILRTAETTAKAFRLTINESRKPVPFLISELGLYKSYEGTAE